MYLTKSIIFSILKNTKKLLFEFDTSEITVYSLNDQPEMFYVVCKILGNFVDSSGSLRALQKEKHFLNETQFDAKRCETIDQFSNRVAWCCCFSVNTT